MSSDAMSQLAGLCLARRAVGRATDSYDYRLLGRAEYSPLNASEKARLWEQIIDGSQAKMPAALSVFEICKHIYISVPP